MQLQLTDHLKTGLYEVDEQHKMIVDTAALFLNAVQSGSSLPDILTIAVFFRNTVESHITFEEQFMQRYAYPDRSRHAILHSTYQSSMKHLINQLGTRWPDDALVGEINYTFRNGLLRHIQREDKQMATAILSNLNHTIGLGTAK
jgi:hemerythrin-like metal-binding protein